jgi:sialic acid synthase SpsE
MTVKFITEVSSNHSQSLDRCIKFIETSAAIGCDAVKFQLFKLEELFAPEVLARSGEHQRRKEWELPTSFLPALAAECKKQRVQFACTPFYLKAVEELEPYVDFFKIASYELLWSDLLTETARTGKPVILSTGMATIDEIDKAVTTLKESGCNDLTLLHCVSGYPTPPEECNLAAINTLRERYKVSTGWSDHSVSPAVIFRAIYHWSAEVVEFHLDLDQEGAEFSGGHCWLPNEITQVIETVKIGLRADGLGEKVPAPSELQDRQWRADPTDGLRPLKKIRDRWWGK